MSAIFLAVAGLLAASDPMPASAVETSAVETSGAENCALTRGGDVYCSGTAAPMRVRVAGRVVQLAATGDSTCALTEPGDVYCWGAGETDAGGFVWSPLVLIALGLLLVGGGVTMVMLCRPGRAQGATSSDASRNWAAPSLSRSA
jgi:hypothetical protein